MNNHVGALDSIVNSDFYACPNYAMNGLDNKRIAGRSDRVVLSNRFDILSDNPDVSSDVDSQCLILSHELSRDELQRLLS